MPGGQVDHHCHVQGRTDEGQDHGNERKSLERPFRGPKDRVNAYPQEGERKWEELAMAPSFQTWAPRGGGGSHPRQETHKGQPGGDVPPGVGDVKFRGEEQSD